MNTGFFCIDKPQGITSHDVVSRMRRILNMKKVGHSGTLDPMATGVLIVGFGPATRLLDYVQSGFKEYVADVRFGTKTSTGDASGSTLDTCDMSSLTLDQLDRVKNEFVGTIFQTPPMVSAIKIDGKKLYEYEREGIEIERPARQTFVESIDIEQFESAVSGSAPQARIRVRCKAGTYIRTLAEDIASSLGGFAYLYGLRRTKNGEVDERNCVTLEELSNCEQPQEKMMTPLQALSHFVHVELDVDQTLAVSHGKDLNLTESQKSIFENSVSEFVVVTGHSPRELIAIYPKEITSNFRSRCVVFTDGL